MSFFDLLSQWLRAALRIVLWLLATVVAVVVVSVALVFLLAWLLVSLVLGRSPQLSVRTRFQDFERFRSTFGTNVFKSGGFGSRPATPDEAEPGPAQGMGTGVNPGDGPLSRRLGQADAVQDVQARDLPEQGPPR